MSVIVKGMEMPNTCEECQESCEIGSNLFCLVVNDENKWGWKKSENGFESRPVWCPLRPLPEKHGRLIDADAMIEEIKVWKEEGEREAKADGVLKPGSSLVAELLIAYLAGNPTIVEAEGDYV